MQKIPKQTRAKAEDGQENKASHAHTSYKPALGWFNQFRFRFTWPHTKENIFSEARAHNVSVTDKNLQELGPR